MNLKDFIISPENLVIEKTEIEKDYEILSPPIGQGIYINSYIGAFGEVRKAINKIGQVRAVKIIPDTADSYTLNN